MATATLQSSPNMPVMPGALLHSWFEAARRRWPSVAWPLLRFERHVGDEEPRHPEDLYLAGAASEREDSAWAAIHLDVQPEVMRRLSRAATGGSSHDDMWSDAIAKLMSDLPDGEPLPDGRRPARIRQYRGTSAIGAYFAVVARRIAVDRFRRNRLPMEGAAHVMEQTADPRGVPARTETAEAMHLAAQFKRAFTALPPQQQALLSLVFGRGMPKGEAGRLLDLPAYGVSRALAAALDTLRLQLAALKDAEWSAEAVAFWLRGWADSLEQPRQERSTR